MNEDRRVVIEEEHGLKFRPLINIIKEKTKFLSRRREKGIINKRSKSSVVVRENGDINITSSANAQYKMNSSGKATEVSHTSETITNKKKITADEVVINNRKLNPKLYEFSDMRPVYNDDNKAVGGLTMMGTVLVKAWEPTLEKYVLIRRLANLPIFSPELNVPDIHPNLDIDSDLEEEFGDMMEIEKMAEMLSDFEEGGRS